MFAMQEVLSFWKESWVREARERRNSQFSFATLSYLGILAITRSLGDEELKQYVIGTPFTSELVLDPAHDIQLVMACDGLWDVLEDHDLHSFVEEEDPTELAQTLVDYALEQGSTDNISVIVVKLFCKKKYHGSGQDSDSPSRHSSDSLNVISLGSSKDQLET